MPRAFSDLDYHFSQFFSSRFEQRAAFSLSGADALTNVVLVGTNIQAVTIPENIDERAFPIGATCILFNANNLVNTIVPDSGVQLNGSASAFALSGNWSQALLHRLDDNSYAINIVGGATTPSTAFSGVLLNLAATPQVLTTSVEAVVTWDTEIYDFGDWWDASSPTEIVVPANVDYVQISVGANFDINATGARQIRAAVNGSNVVGSVNQLVQTISTATSVVVMGTSAPIAVNEGDVITVLARQTSDSNLNLVANNNTRVGVWKVS